MTIPVAAEPGEATVLEDASKNKPSLSSFKPGDLITLAIGGWFFQHAIEKLLHGHFVWAAIFAAIGITIAKKPLKKILQKFFPNKNI